MKLILAERLKIDFISNRERAELLNRRAAGRFRTRWNGMTGCSPFQGRRQQGPDSMEYTGGIKGMSRRYPRAATGRAAVAASLDGVRTSGARRAGVLKRSEARSRR